MFKALKAAFGWYSFQQIEPMTLQQRLQDGEPIIVLDVRSKEEFEFHGHIPQAQLAPLLTLAEFCKALPKETTLVCVDRSGRRGEQACKILLDLNFSEVINLRGGMRAWRKSGLPIEK